MAFFAPFSYVFVAARVALGVASQAGLCWAYVLGEVCAIVSDMNSESQARRV